MPEQQKMVFRELTVEQQQHRLYFARLSLQGFNAFKMHKAIGLWERKNVVGEQTTWKNVSEHCLVEMARVKVLATTFMLSEALQKDLLIAAAMHDFYKEQEIKIIKTEGASWASFAKASQQSTEIMRKAGLHERVIWLANAVAHGSLEETLQILQKERLPEEDISFLIMHFVDDSTRDTGWAEPCMVLHGEIINELDRRMEKNEKSITYRPINEEGRRIFNGETTFQAQRRIGHLVEDRLANLLRKHTNEKISPRHLPEFIDNTIKNEITSIHISFHQ